MPTSYLTSGYVRLEGVSFSGTEGQPGSSINWTSLTPQDGDLSIFDQDDDGNLDTGTDFFESVTYLFSGYTVTSGGVEYGVFADDTGGYFIPLPQDGSTQTIIASSGGSNAFQSEASGMVYLCFGEGTGIATPGGETKVESLQIGDLVRCADGRDVPVTWVGRQTLVKHFAGPRAQLVRIAAGALGNHTDLYVTGDHGMVFGSGTGAADGGGDGFVVNASALVNGETICWVPLAQTPERQTVYHIETAAHDVILANGAASETFIDYAGRRAFDNWAEYEALYGREQPIAENPMPRISSARLLPDHLRARLAASHRLAG